MAANGTVLLLAHVDAAQNAGLAGAVGGGQAIQVVGRFLVAEEQTIVQVLLEHLARTLAGELHDAPVGLGIGDAGSVDMHEGTGVLLKNGLGLFVRVEVERQ